MTIPFVQEKIYQYYLPNCSINGRNISSPFRRDRSPSFNIRKVGKWIKWKDWGTGEEGNCFDLVAKLKGLDTKIHFNEVLHTICVDLGLTHLYSANENTVKKLIELNNLSRKNLDVLYNIKDNVKVNIKFRKKLFNSDELNYWHSQGVLFNSTLSYLDIYSVKDAYVIADDYVKNIYQYSERKNMDDFLEIRKFFFCFAYKYGDEFVKLYRPYHFDKWKSTVPSNLVCTKTLFDNDTLIITKAKKEQAHLFDISRFLVDKFDILPLNNETTFVDWYYHQIKDKYKKIILWLDSDQAGINFMKVLNQKYNLSWYYTNIGKNITDIYSNGYGIINKEQNIKNSICVVKNALSL